MTIKKLWYWNVENIKIYDQNQTFAIESNFGIK